MTTAMLKSPATQRLTIVLCIACFLAAVFGVSFQSLWQLWQTGDHRHGLLVIPISAFLIWRKRAALSDAPIEPFASGLFVLLPLTICWLLARLAGVQVVEHFSALAMIPTAILTLVGWQLTRQILFPLGFLLFATPLGDGLVPVLMVVTADISSFLLEISGFPIYRDGQFISLPGGEFVVADVCSGIRYLVTGVMLASLYGYLTFTDMRKRSLLIIATAATLVLANGIRAYIVMAVASLSDMKYFGGRDHIYFGWILFGIVMVSIMVYASRYADDEPLEPGAEDSDRSKGSSGSVPQLIASLALIMLAITVVPLQADLGEENGSIFAAIAALLIFIVMLLRRGGAEQSKSEAGSQAFGLFRIGGRRAATLITAVAALVAAPMLAARIEGSEGSSVASVDVSALRSCQSAGPWRSVWQPEFNNADFEIAVTLSCEGRYVGLYAAAYASALQGKELISAQNLITPEEWQRFSDTALRMVETSDGRQDNVLEISVERSETVVWYWYEVGNKVSTGPAVTKLRQLNAQLRSQPSGGRVVVLETTMRDGIDAARERLSGLAREIIGQAGADAGSSAE